MRIAVINEISASGRNNDILNALEGRGFEIYNLGNTGNGSEPELLYIHTGLMTAILLHLNAVDLVVGGCGTGLGFLNSAMQYPGVFCGHLLTPLDAWLFARINAGNCVSLALNQGYGWAGEINLKLIFDNLFGSEIGTGYPAHRAEPQRQARALLGEISKITHHNMYDVLASLPKEVTQPALTFPPFTVFLKDYLGSDPRLQASIQKLS